MIFNSKLQLLKMSLEKFLTLKNSLKNYFMKGKKIGHKCILNLFNQPFSTNYKGRWFLIIRKPKSSNK